MTEAGAPRLQLARSCVSTSTGAASSAPLVSPRSRFPGEGFSPFSATLPVMSNARAASSAVGFDAPPWLIVGPPLFLVISFAPSFREHEAAFGFLGRGAVARREQAGGDLGDVAALEAGGIELVRRGAARAVAAGNGRGAIGAAAGHLVEDHLPLEGIRQAHRHHS